MVSGARVVFRADGGARTGLGHLSRCAALAVRLKSLGAECVLACTGDSVEAARAFWADGDIHSLPAALSGKATAIGERLGPAAWLVVDHYGLGVEFERAARSFASHILVTDDFGDAEHAADIILDVTSPDRARLYRERNPGADLLLGPSYAPLRPEFAQLRGRSLARRRSQQGINRILVSFGGSDTHAINAAALAAVAEWRAEIPVDLVVVRPEDAAPPTENVKVHVRPHAVAELMFNADLAIGAGGVTCWERASLGLPALVMGIAENQRQVIEVLRQSGAAAILENVEDITRFLRELQDDDARLGMVRSAAALCDGRGAHRIAMRLLPEKAKSGGAVWLRPAVPDDCKQLFAWQCLPETRRYSRQTRPPTLSEHEAWFKAKLNTPDCLLNVIVHEGQDAGVLRLDYQANEDSWEISILLAPECYGKGIAAAALRLGRRLLPEAHMIAEVHPANISSLNLFRAAGFQPTRPGWYCQPPSAAGV